MNQERQNIEKAFHDEVVRNFEFADGINPRGTEQMRYEAAKEIMVALLASGSKHSPDYLAKEAIGHADALMSSFQTFEQ